MSVSPLDARCSSRRSLVNLKRSKSAPGLIEASCRLPSHVPVRRTGSGIHRLSSVKESDVRKIQPSIGLVKSASSSTEQAKASVSNSLLTVAPLASSVSVASSLNSSSVLTNEIEYLKRCLSELEQETPSATLTVQPKYHEIQQRLKVLQEKKL